MKLLIVESPAKAKTISKYLEGAYTVKASVGHVRDLPKSNKKAIDIEAGFVPHYEVSPGKDAVLNEIMQLADKADEVLLATDPDREGEAIAWHIAQAAKLKKPQRVVFYEITKDAVREAILHPRAIDQNLRKAQEARRVLDRLVGYDLSGLIWKKVRYGLSAGRVQSPALRIIMEREREIRAFISHKFWVISADVETKKKEKITVTCVEEPLDFKKVEDIIAIGKKQPWNVVSVDETEASRSPKAPFITSTLQQTASTRLGYAPSRTMSVAQRLYEAGLITYMRTDSTNLSQVALGQIAGLVEREYGKQYHQFRTFAAKSKNAQEAHEAVRPTDVSVMSAGANDEQKKLYELIWQRTVASQMSDAKILRTKVTANIKAGSITIPDFTANGSRVLFDGWLKADPDARGEDVELPKVEAGSPLDLINITSLEKETQPPSRYTEAGLIKELEKRGIGRPSTYASIIRTIETRGYVEKENRTLKPTDTGDVVSSFLEANFADYISDTFTAEMEDKLDSIAEGKLEYEKTLKDFYGPFTKDVKSKDKLAKATDLGAADTKYICPKCGTGDMTIKLGRGGKFISCNRYPDCDGALTIDGKEIKKDEPIGNDPATGLPIFVNVGRFGPYVQLGEKTKENKKPRMASIPKTADIENVSVADAVKYLSLPRELGVHPETQQKITASVGRFGPYIVHEKDFRSLKTDDVYTIGLDRALEILKQPKAIRRGRFAKKTTETTTSPEVAKETQTKVKKPRTKKATKAIQEEF
ncbi:MAG: type I DNA topoisomerase [Candidatus Taylorbacteria bacterium]|nr:type I DNA topoisomerase [Candidatus Taylorbacteria bacterium]